MRAIFTATIPIFTGSSSLRRAAIRARTRADLALGSAVRLNGTTGAALPAPGKTGAVFVSPGTPQIGTDPKLAFDTAGRLIVASNLDFVLSLNTATGTLAGSAVIGKGHAVP